jgi:O-antigen ligase
MWRERPLLGVGPDNFRRLYGPYLGPRALDDRVNANSLYVETLADLGLVGAASLALLFVALAHGAVRAWRSDRAPERMVVIASGAALVAFALHGIVDNVLPATPLYGLFWIHAGLLAGRSSEGKGKGVLPDDLGEDS